MATQKCNAHECWCGNRDMEITSEIRNSMDDILLAVDGRGIYVSNGGCTEHWDVDSDFYEQYPGEENRCYPAVVEAVEREYPEAVEDTLDGISCIEIVEETENGGVLYSVSATEDFWVIEGETGTGIFYRTEEEARYDWNLKK